MIVKAYLMEMNKKNRLHHAYVGAEMSDFGKVSDGPFYDGFLMHKLFTWNLSLEFVD